MKSLKQLKDVLFADGIIDPEEVEFLFEINDAVSGKYNDTNWETLFIDAITSYLLRMKSHHAELMAKKPLGYMKKLRVMEN